MSALTRPSYSGVYPIHDAASLIQVTTPQTPNPIDLSTRHLYKWVREGLAGNYLTGLRGKEVALTFLDLVSFRMIAIFRSYKIRPREIQVAHQELQTKRGWSYPFAMEQIWISGPDLFIKEPNSLVAISRGWQLAFDFISEYLIPAHDLVFGDNAEAASWEPEPGIQLNPKMSFGEPCLRDTRIPTEVLWALHSAGDSVERISKAYDLRPELVEAAIAWEEKLAA